MKFVDEFREPEVITKTAEEIRRLADPDRHYRIMEVCGGHTHAIYRFGLKDLLPSNIELIHGPGCPVCVLPDGQNRRRAVHRSASQRYLRRLWRHDARSGHAGKPARTQGSRDGCAHRLFSVRRAEARANESRQARHVFCHWIRDHRSFNGTDAGAGEGRRAFTIFPCSAIT